MTDARGGEGRPGGGLHRECVMGRLLGHGVRRENGHRSNTQVRVRSGDRGCGRCGEGNIH